MCLNPETLILFNQKAIKKYGAEFGILHFEDIENLEDYVEQTGNWYGWDDIEKICLAVYQITKKHPFLDANKRTAQYVLINCLREIGYSYVGREIDLARKLESLAQTLPNEKETSILELSFFLKRQLQRT